MISPPGVNSPPFLKDFNQWGDIPPPLLDFHSVWGLKYKMNLFQIPAKKICLRCGAYCAILSLFRNALVLVTKLHTLHLNSVLCFLSTCESISFPCFPVKSHREHFTLGLIMASGPFGLVFLGLGFVWRGGRLIPWSCRSTGAGAGGVMPRALRLPQVFLKPRKMHSSSSAVHWRRHAELG